MENIKDIKINWDAFKAGVRVQWGFISDEELDHTKGSINQIKQIVKRKMRNESWDEVNKKMQRLIDSFDNPTDRKVGLSGESSYQRRPIK